MNALARELSKIVGSEHVLCPVPPGSPCNFDSTGPWRGLTGKADAEVCPANPTEIAALLALSHRHSVPVVPRGGGTGVSGGATPTSGGIVLSLRRMKSLLSLTPEQWQIEVQAGLTTAHTHRLARESGLLFPPDPGAGEHSQIGGNIATDAGGPHALKYGSTRHWVTALTAVIPPGEVLHLGTGLRKDVSTYNLPSLMAGSEGTLGVIASATLRLIPAPESALCLVAFFPDHLHGCAALLEALSTGVVPSALDFLSGAALSAIAATYPGEVPAPASFALIAEVDGTRPEAEAARSDLAGLLGDSAIAVDSHDSPTPVWQWREGASSAVASIHGGKVSEDVAVPVPRLHDLLSRFSELASLAGLPSCAWGHAGDGNVHATVMVDPHDPASMHAAEAVTAKLFELVLELGGSLSGEHGIGLVKRDALAAALSPGALRLQRGIKQAFDPHHLMNPGKKVP